MATYPIFVCVLYFQSYQRATALNIHQSRLSNLKHVIDLAMWGFHDHSLSMRKALNETLITSKPNNALYRRWRWTQSVQNKKVDEIVC
jgi:hypothetical protein